MKASRKNPALAGLILVIGVVFLLVALPYAIAVSPTGDATFSVEDTSGAAVQNATVYAIPAEDVAELAAVPINLQATGNYDASSLAVDEPLEDIINGNFVPSSGGVGTYASGTVDASGTATLPTLDTSAGKSYFIYVKPDAGDTGHLPGGSISRQALSGAALDNNVTSITVSTKASDSATFVGSSSCLACHTDKTDMKKTAHKSGFMVPRSPSALQDTSKFDTDDGDWNMFAALDNKFTSTGTTVYFYDYDSTRKFDKFMTSETDPGAGHTVAATVKVWKDDVDGKYKFTFHNVLNPADPDITEEVSLTYGGGVYKQRYMTAQGASIHVLPLQYNARGDEAAPERTRKQWRDYHLDWWLNSAGTASQTFKAQPANNNAVDIQCATCHFNGYSVTKDPVTGIFSASGVADPNGEIHPVTGDHQELNIGCETCHGPGSEHVTAGGNGEAIVTPQNITPERETNICAQCHSRSQGNDGFGIKKDSPLNTANKMMIAGTSRADFLAQYTTRHDAASGDRWPDGLHSKSHHQQYTDFIKSSLYRNSSSLETCASCHDNHAPGTDRNQLSGTSDDSLCLGCHATVNSVDHQIDKTGANMGADCIQCHNAKTSSSGAGSNVLSAYPHGDISSHLFDVPDNSKIGTAKMPVPFTNACASCHTTIDWANYSPSLSLSKTNNYWADYADYSNRVLSVDFSVSNAGPRAFGVDLLGTVNTMGVSTQTAMSIPLGDLGVGDSAATTVKYGIPAGVTTFKSSIYADGNNVKGHAFNYPGPYPGP